MNSSLLCILYLKNHCFFPLLMCAVRESVCYACCVSCMIPFFTTNCMMTLFFRYWLKYTQWQVLFIQSGKQNGRHEKNPSACTNLKKLIYFWKKTFSKKVYCWGQTGWNQDQGPLWALVLVPTCLILYKNTNWSISRLKCPYLTLG